VNGIFGVTGRREVVPRKRHVTEPAPQRRTHRRAVRVAPAFWMTVLALFVIAVGVLPAAGDPLPPRPTASTTYRVSPSDTLWSIAAVHRLPGLSTAQMVRVIRDANAASDVLEPGVVLRVPTATGTSAAYAQVTALQAGN
jgi:Tfp pilus assembly protein FimV